MMHNLIGSLLSYLLCLGDEVALGVALLHPGAQRLSLVHRPTQSENLPPKQPNKGNEQNGQRDLDPPSHGGSMGRMQRNSRQLGAARPRPRHGTVLARAAVWPD